MQFSFLLISCKINKDFELFGGKDYLLVMDTIFLFSKQKNLKPIENKIIKINCKLHSLHREDRIGNMQREKTKNQYN